MKKEIEITKDNYEDYVKLYERRNIFSNKREKFKYCFVLSTSFIVLCFLTYEIVSQINMLEIVENFKMIIKGLICIGGTTAIMTVPHDLANKSHEKMVGKDFPNINTKIKTYQLEEMLEKANSLASEKIDVTTYENTIRNQNLIEKYEQIKEKMLEEYRRDYSSLEYDTSVSEEQLENVTEKVKKLVR